MKTDLENLPLVIDVDVVRQLCEPLRSLGISDFFFMRVFKDNTIIDLATHLEWGTHFFSKLYQGIYPKNEIENHFFPTNYLSLWENYPENNIWQEGKNYFEVGNGISILKRQNEYNDIFSFFTDKNNFKLNEFYINHLDLLEKFIIYFKEGAKQVIRNAEKYRLTIPAMYCQEIAIDAGKFQHMHADFLNKIDNNKKGEPFLQLSKRECECLYWIASGKTAEEIGCILGCSKRTIEFHINNARAKTGTNKITMLIYQATKHGVI